MRTTRIPWAAVAAAVLLCLLPAAPAGAKVTLPFQAADTAGGLTQLFAATRAPKLRAGLGQPSYARLLGRRWRTRAAAADAALVRRMTGAPARTRAAAIADPQDADPLGAGDALRGIRGSQRRKLRIAVGMDSGCPKYAPPGYHYFEYGITARGDYEVTTVERVGRWDVTTAVVLEVRFRGSSTTHADATLGDYLNDEGTVSVTRRQTARDRRTGRTKVTGPTERTTQSLSPLLILDGDFDDFIAANDDARPAPRTHLRSAAWSELAQKFVAVVYLEVVKDMKAAEAVLRTPNRCVGLALEGPARLAPGQLTKLVGRVVARRPEITPAQILEGARVVDATFVNDQGQSLKYIGRLNSTEDFTDGQPWYDFTAPPKAWPEGRPAGVTLTLATPTGIATGTITFGPIDTTMHFRVVGASLRIHTDATSDDTYCGTVAGSKTFSGDFADDGFDADDLIEVRDGRWSGQVDARVAARWTDHHLEGCRSGPNGKERCATTMPDRAPGGDGTWPISFAASGDASAGEVTLTWSLDQPEVGFVDRGDEECNVHIWSAFPLERRIRKVAVSALQGSGPVTVTFADTGTLDVNNDGMDHANITHTWEYTLTLQRVAADGSPL